MPPLKWILGAIGIFNLASAINYLYFDNSNDLTCRIQASMLQFFEIGSTMYAFIMALETHVLIGIITNSLERLRFTMNSKKTLTRHICYHMSIILYGIGTVLWINLTHSYGGNGTWCWIERPYYRLYLFYIPTWLSIFAIMYLDIEVIRVVYKSYQQLKNLRAGTGSALEATAAGAGPGDHASIAMQSAMNAKMLRVFMRMTLYPICLLLLVMPGSVVRVIQAGDFNIDGTVFRILSIARNM